jgi:hemolysin activation/secretion protein
MAVIWQTPPVSAQTTSQSLPPFVLRSLTISTRWPDPLALSKPGRGISSPAMALSPEARRKLAAALGKEVGAAELARIARLVALVLRQQGRPAVQVAFPRQNFGDGHIYLYVQPPLVRDLVIEPADLRNERAIRPLISQTLGSELDAGRAENDVAVLNLARKWTQLRYRPTGEADVVDMVVRTRNAQRLSGYLRYDDSGSSSTGATRLKGGITWNEALGPSSRLNYSFTSAADPNVLNSQALSLSAVTPARFAYSLSLSSNRTILPGVAPAVTSVTNERNYSIGLSTPASTVLRNMNGTFNLNLSRKEHLNISVTGTGSVVGSDTELAQLSFGYKGRKNTKLGNLKYSIGLRNSVSGIAAKHNATAFASRRTGADANFTILTLRMSSEAAVFKRYGLRWSLAAQTSAQRLLPSEQISFGGTGSVRGYVPGVVSGDSGLNWRFEISAPLVQFRLAGPEVKLRPSFFYEGALTRVSSPILPETNKMLQSAGFAIRAQLNNKASLQYSFGLQLPEVGFDDGETMRHNFGVTYSF